ncbi:MULTISPECIES: glycosyltransferase [unclassified Leucobacter]|uniref:nucleotide disphospho-sugar-binding domain-containing protein n=1 Tax=unclassified Leucobacter TaxID=2621730 RepID=UPI00165E7C6C|nr:MULTISPECIES: glycosyltransferase [unclassified Leucobacter]MBC9935999.1 glycosyltransferase family 1 protein [Leucobacter sp. cx-87]
MTLLIISPDYASHLYPLAALGSSWLEAGERVVVATGPATASIVRSFGYEHVSLQLSRGSNPGIIRAEEQPDGEDDALRGFFAATREGMIQTLSFQAEARLNDLMWEPVATARAVQAIVEDLNPTTIMVDHLAYSARLALVAAGIDYVDVVLGHPTALPMTAAGEVYGLPPAWPSAFSPSEQQVTELRELCEQVSQSFTSEWNTALAELAPNRAPSPNAFAEHGDPLVFNYPAELMPPDRLAHLPAHQFIGASVRAETPEPHIEEWLSATDEPFVYVSFGSFLSVRGDVLGKVAEALRVANVRAAIAYGSADIADLGDVPDHWLVGEFLPQVTLLGAAALGVTHGGNNSVTEALTFGVPLVVLPFSTDQFAGAEALERIGFGAALAPNEATVAEIKIAIDSMLNLPEDARRALHDLGATLRAREGHHALAGRVRPLNPIAEGTTK